MATVYTLTVAVPDSAARSTWVNTGGAVSQKTTGTGTSEVTIPAIPVGASITRVLLTVTVTTPVGYAEILTANGLDMTASSVNNVDLTGDMPTPGTYTITYRYRSSGRTGLSDGEHQSTVRFEGGYLTVEYITGDPVPTPEEEETPDTVLQTAGEIILYSPWAVSFGGTYGAGLLTPSECSVVQEAGGEYSLTLKHPLTPDGRWRQIVPFAIVRAPVPAEDTPFIDGAGEIVTEGLEIWRAEADAGWYLTTAYTIRPTWQPSTYYPKDSYFRWNGYNYRCLVAHTSSTVWSDTQSLWKSQGDGGPKPARTLPEWTRLYVSDSSGATWLYVKLSTGETGYVKKSEAVYMRTATAQDIEELSAAERHITDQPFRLTDVTIDGSGVTARGQHVSYDANLWLLGDIEIMDEPIGDAILDIKAALIGETPDPDGREPFRIFAQEMGTTITAKYSGKTPTAAILDPEIGLVPLYRSRLVRDNWDFFLVSNEPTDRGFRLEYGVNLTGVNWKRDFSGLVTRVMPVAKDEDGEDFLLPETFVDSPIRNAYPVTAYEILQVDAQIGGEKPEGGTWTEVEVIAEMRARAADRFLVDHADEPRVELSVEFAFLGQAAGFEQYRGLERVSLYDTVTVDHPDIGLQTTVQVKGYEWDAIRQRFNRLSLGNVYDYGTRQIPGYEVADGAITLAKIDRAALQQLTGGNA